MYTFEVVCGRARENQMKNDNEEMLKAPNYKLKENIVYANRVYETNS